MANTRFLSNIKSSIVNTVNGVSVPKNPDPNDIIYGQIAINYAHGYETFFIKNSNNNIVPFSNDNTIMSYITSSLAGYAKTSDIKTVNDSSVTFTDMHGNTFGSFTLNAAKGLTIKFPQTCINYVTNSSAIINMAIQPNTFYNFIAPSSLSLSLASVTSSSPMYGYYQEYMFSFTSGSTAPTVSLPNTLKWQTTLKVEANKTYHISIVDYCATWAAF